MLTGARRVLPLFAISLCAISSQLKSDDSWEHFASGGMFRTRSPSLSRDNKTMVYATPCTGHGDIYSLRAEIAQPNRLTSSDDFESSPILVPKTDDIIYCREHDGQRHLWKMHISGKGQKQLTTGTVLDEPIAVASTGEYILFQRVRVTARGTSVATACVLGSDNSDRSIRELGHAALFSPDGRYVVYTEDMKSLKRHVLDPTPGEKGDEHFGFGIPLSFSADAKHLLTSVPPSQSQASPVDWEMWVHDIKNKKSKMLAHGHSAILFGTKTTHLLYWRGFERSPVIVGIHGESKPLVIECGTSHKTMPILCGMGRGVVFCGFARSGEAACEVFHISDQYRKASRLALIDCSRVVNELATLSDQ